MVWFTALGYSPPLQGSQGRRFQKWPVTPTGGSMEKWMNECLAQLPFRTLTQPEVPCQGMVLPTVGRQALLP